MAGDETDPIAALHAAVLKKDSAAVAQLAAAGTDVDALPPGAGRSGGGAGCAPLYAAVRQGDVETVRVLLQHGADVNICTGGGSTPLCRAAQDGAFDVLEELLASPHVQVDKPRQGGRTPLFVAAQHGHTQCVEALVEAGADATTAVKASKRKTGRRSWTAMEVAEKARADASDPLDAARFGAVVSLLKCVQPPAKKKPEPQVEQEPTQEPEQDPTQESEPEPKPRELAESGHCRRNERRPALAIESNDMQVIDIDGSSSEARSTRKGAGQQHGRRTPHDGSRVRKQRRSAGARHSRPARARSSEYYSDGSDFSSEYDSDGYYSDESFRNGRSRFPSRRAAASHRGQHRARRSSRHGFAARQADSHVPSDRRPLRRGQAAFQAVRATVRASNMQHHRSSSPNMAFDDEVASITEAYAEPPMRAQRHWKAAAGKYISHHSSRGLPQESLPGVVGLPQLSAGQTSPHGSLAVSSPSSPPASVHLSGSPSSLSGSPSQMIVQEKHGTTGGVGTNQAADASSSFLASSGPCSMLCIGTTGLAVELLAAYSLCLLMFESNSGTTSMDLVLQSSVRSDSSDAGGEAERWETILHGPQNGVGAVCMALANLCVVAPRCGCGKQSQREHPISDSSGALVLSVACCFAAMLAVLQVSSAVLLWQQQPLTTKDLHAAVIGVVVFLGRTIGGALAWSSRRHETLAQNQLRELKIFVRRSGLQLPEHLGR